MSILIDDLLQNANNTEKGLELGCFLSLEYKFEWKQASNYI